MNCVTRNMIKKYDMMKLKYDFMGYQFQRQNQLSFHHLIVPARNCKNQGLGKGILEWNGAILVQDTAHDYLHILENYDYEMFLAITSEMIDINIKGFIDMENLKRINFLLTAFEIKYCGMTTKRGVPIIKEEFTKRLLRK